MELSNYKPSLSHQKKTINAESLKTRLGLCAFYPLKILRAFAFLHFNTPESIQSISAKALYPLPILYHIYKVFLFHQSIHIFSL